jgi:hypothetical protein
VRNGILSLQYLVGFLLTLLLGDFPFVLKIALVGNKTNVDIFVGVLLDVCHPPLDVLKRILVCDVVRYQDTHGTSVGERTTPLMLVCTAVLQIEPCGAV